MKNLYWVLAGLLVFVALGISVFVVYMTTQRTLSPVEGILWQVFVLTTGLAGSFIFGRQSARDAAREILKPHARNAARYLISLYKSVSRAAGAIGSSRNFESNENYYIIRAYLIGIFGEQMATADDALENWRDILGEELEDLIQKLREGAMTSEELENLIQELVPDNTPEEE